MNAPGHRLLIPSYNTGPKLRATVLGALARWPATTVVVDGSTDGSDACLEEIRKDYPTLDILRLAKNGGKGAAVLAGAERLAAEGATHVLCMDADGQHPEDKILPMMALSTANPDATIMGRPVFGPEVPPARLHGRKLTIFWTTLETPGCALGDTLFGMRVYPVSGLLRAFRQTPFARGYDFDPEIAVRLCWLGHPALQLDAPVRYFKKSEGGVSHFAYLRDNVKLTLLHFRLVPEGVLFQNPPHVAAPTAPHVPMSSFRRLLLLPILFAFAAHAHAEEAPLIALDPVKPTEAWKPILAGLAKNRLIESTFTENRYMRLRKKPFETPGTMRYLPGLGVSITREAESEEVVLVKPDGLYKREDDGVFKKIPFDVAATRAPRLLLSVVGFEAEKVAKDFTVTGETHDSYWTMELTPRSADIASAVSKMRITGFRDKLMTITLYDEDRIRLEIVIRTATFPESFAPAVKKKYFGE